MTILRAGLIGSNISGSRFGAALELLCSDAGIDLEFDVIDTADASSFRLPDLIHRLRAEGWTGVSVTHPWKADAATIAGRHMAAEVQGIGAANLLVFQPAFAGHNTDFLGFRRAWRDVFKEREPGRVAMAGAGGVARAIAAALLSLGASRLEFWDPSPGVADRLARELGPRTRAVAPEEAEKSILHADGLVNATPLGMGTNRETAFGAGLIGPQSWAFDAVYTPTDTPFLVAAAERGLACLTGFDLFRFMSLDSFETYTGLCPEPARALALIAPLCPREVVA